MSTWGQRALAASGILVAVLSLGAGCFKPTIQDGGLLCAGGADGGVCPEGYYCSANGTCRKGTKMACLPASPHLEQICEPDAGTDCDPICQSRCDCGRCTYNGTGLVCLPPGTKERGALCNPAADDCAPGNFCRRDCKTIARCSRFCGKDGNKRDVCDGQNCQIFLNDALGNPTDIAVCDPPVQTCNPVGNSDECGSSELGCYVKDTTGETVCDCKGMGTAGSTCGLFNSCNPGFRCVGMGGNPATCVKTCRTNADCAPSACAPIGSGGQFGFCAP